MADRSRSRNRANKNRLPKWEAVSASSNPEGPTKRLAHASQFLLAVVPVMLMPVALVRPMDMARFLTVVLVLVALMVIVDMARRLVFSHVQHLAPVFGHQPVFNSAL